MSQEPPRRPPRRRSEYLKSNRETQAYSILTEIRDADAWLAHRTLFLSMTQQIRHRYDTDTTRTDPICGSAQRLSLGCFSCSDEYECSVPKIVGLGRLCQSAAG